MDKCIRCFTPSVSSTRLCDECKSELMSFVGISYETISVSEDSEKTKA